MGWNFYTDGGEIVEAAVTLDGYTSEDFVKITGDSLSGPLKVESSPLPEFRLATSSGASDINSARFGIATLADDLSTGSISGDTVISAKSGGNLLIGVSTSGNQQASAVSVANNRVVNLERPCAVRASLGTLQAITTGISTWQTVAFDTEASDVEGMHASGVITLGSGLSGLYLIEAKAKFDDNATGLRHSRLLVNSSFEYRMAGPIAAAPVGVDVHVGGTWVVNLDGGDQVEFQVSQSSGGNLNVLTGPTDTYINLVRLPYNL